MQLRDRSGDDFRHRSTLRSQRGNRNAFIAYSPLFTCSQNSLKTFFDSLKVLLSRL
jgi:hypothetical protein